MRARPSTKVGEAQRASGEAGNRFPLLQMSPPGRALENPELKNMEAVTLEYVSISLPSGRGALRGLGPGSLESESTWWTSCGRICSTWIVKSLPGKSFGVVNEL
jgi:hypothetical protein